jgi:pSer/pThr/pTyr-binding forkhead associated (FHA) protein
MSEAIKLTVTSPTEAYTFHMTDGSVLIGRSTKCDFNIPREDLSREHCLFEIIDGEYYVTDLDSSNGVWVDRVRIPPQKKVKVTLESVIGFSNLYSMRINAFEIKTKFDLLKQIDKDKETVTFHFDLDEPVIEHVTEKTKKKLPKKAGPPTQKQEYTRMIIGFILILAFALFYQALGL